MDRNIFITRFDKDRLEDVLSKTINFSTEDQDFLKTLRGELARATIVESKDIPSDVVTMNSTVCIEDLKTGEEETYSLVFPGYADYKENAISILAPVGTALLGYKEGDVIEWKVPGGTRRLKVKKVCYQPEASGHYTL